MTSPSSSRPSRPSEPPSRHSISATSASRLKDVHPSPRASNLAPTRGKLKHAATAPPTSAAALTSSFTDPHACRNCHQMDTRFYCDPCLASRIHAHLNEMRRVSLLRDKAKASTSQLLFGQASNHAHAASPASTFDAAQLAVVNETALPDPFDVNAAEPSTSDPTQQHLFLHSLQQFRAQQAAIVSRVQNIHQCISESQHAHLQGKEMLKEKRAHLAMRKQNLAKAWSSLEGSSASSSTSAAQRSRHAAKSRWLAHPAADHIDVPLVYTDVYTHYERQTDDLDSPSIPSQESTRHQLGATLTRVRTQLASLHAEAKAVSAELAAKRAALARRAFDLYTVSPPGAMAAKLSDPLSARQVDLSASASVAQRISRLSERYIPGAFGLGHAYSPASTTQARNPTRETAATHRHNRNHQSSASSASSSSNWSIASLPLPLPSEARRYPRDIVNGAVTYLANLLQLVAGYLGVALPFAIEQHKGRLAIRPDPLWDGGGGSSAKTLYLSSSAYAHLTAAQSAATRQSKLNNLAESTIGLGASTLSTIESYIHLPSGTGLPWGLTSTTAQPPKAVSADADADSEPSSQTDSRASSSSVSSSKAKPDQAAKSFVSALVMLSYDVAYLATKQGVKLDLVAAASNPLHLLNKIMQQPELGHLAHANHIRATGIEDLSLPSLDYEQLAQILEPSNASADNHKRGSSRPSKADASNAVGSRQSSNKSGKAPKILEQSYVDVGEAAASVLSIKQPSSVAPKIAPQPSSSPSTPHKTAPDHKVVSSRQISRSDTNSGLQKQRSGADQRVASAAPAQPPPSLDFLRQRGRDATKPKSTTPAKVGPGAVIFNGVEVGVGNRPASPPSQALTNKSHKSRKQSAEEGWDLV